MNPSHHHQPPQQSPCKATEGGCYRCNQVGHWVKDCPINNRSPINKRTPISYPISTSTLPRTQCRCGAGFCEIRVSHSDANPNRQYYCCPGKFEMYCRFFKWCTQLKSGDIREIRPEPYPMCGCEAGVCMVLIEDGLCYFVCNIAKGYGACNFKQRMEKGQELHYLSLEDAAVRRARALDFSSEVVQVQMENGVGGSSGIAHGMSPGSSEVLHSVRKNDFDSEITTKNGDMLLNMGNSHLMNVEASVSQDFKPLGMPENHSSWEGCPKLEEFLPKKSVLKSGQNEGNFVTSTILQASEKLSDFPQNDLITLLGSVDDPKNNEKLMKECYVVAALVPKDYLGIDYGLFHLRVIEYIKQAAALSCDRNKNKIICFMKKFSDFCEAWKAYTASNERLISFHKYASCIGDLSADLEEELWCCKVENGRYRERLLQVTKTLSECMQGDHLRKVLE